MKDALFAERPQVKFEGFRFNNELIRNILNGHPGKIGLSCGRADARKFLRCEGDDVVPVRVVIGENLQFFQWPGIAAEESQTVEIGFLGHLRHIVTPAFSKYDLL
jgi:hypothetical protein